jgi:hypothetical protein
MRKAVVIVASLAAFASAQPAFAVKKTICHDHYKILWSTITPGCRAAVYNCRLTPIQGGLAYRECYDADVPPAPTTPWQGSASGFGQAIQQQKSKRAN